MTILEVRLPRGVNFLSAAIYKTYKSTVLLIYVGRLRSIALRWAL